MFCENRTTRAPDTTLSSLSCEVKKLYYLFVAQDLIDDQQG